MSGGPMKKLPVKVRREAGHSGVEEILTLGHAAVLWLVGDVRAFGRAEDHVMAGEAGDAVASERAEMCHRRRRIVVRVGYGVYRVAQEVPALWPGERGVRSNAR